MSSTPQAVAIYARISSDQDGTALGVQRQLEDCRRLCADLGWTVAEEYVDNDISAYSGRKARPAYDRMLSDLSDGFRDALVAYHVDRLTRRPIELEHFVETATTAGLRHVRFVAGGDLDLANGDGLMVIRMLAAVAANESASKGRRVRRKLDQVAQAGLPHGGSNRPFGYEDDKLTVREPEAAVIRSLAERHLAGESLASLVEWLHAEGIPTVNGAEWRTTTIRRLLASPRIAGLREHRGQIVGPAAWPAIITEQQRAGILAAYAARAANPTRRTPRRYLLSGLLRCGRCGNKLYSNRRQSSRRYVCSSSIDHGGCGHLTVVAPPLEELITDAVLYRLDTPELAAALSGGSVLDDRGQDLAGELADDQRQLDEVARMFANKQVSLSEWITIRDTIEGRMARTRRELARSSRNDALAGLVANGQQLRTQWAGLTLSRQASIISAVLDHATIAPGNPGARALDPERVQPAWRL